MSSSLSTRPQITSNLDVTADWHTLTITQTLAQLETNDRIGLTEPQIIDRQQEFGANELVAAASRQWWQILIDQFTNIMLVMLLIVAVVSGIFDFIEIQAGKAIASTSSIKVLKSPQGEVVQQVATLAAEYQIGGEGYIPTGEFKINSK